MRDLSVKKQYILKFTLTMLMPLLLVSVVFYYVHLRTVEGDIINMEHYRLNQALDATETRLKGLMEIRAKIKTDERLLPASIKNDAYLSTTVKSILKSHNATNKLCDNIQIYYRAFDGVYSNEGFTQLAPFLRMRYALTDADAEFLTGKLNGCSSFEYYPLTLSGKPYWAFLYPLEHRQSVAYMTLFYFIRADAFSENLYGGTEYKSAQYTALYNERGVAIFDDMGGHLSAPEGDIEAEGVYELQVSGGDYTVIYVVSDYNQWRYSSAFPTRALLSGVRQQELLLLQVGLMALVLGAGIVVFFARDSYRPIQGLARTVGANCAGNELDAIRNSVLEYKDSYTQLSQLLDRRTPFMVDSIMENLLSGRIPGDVCREMLAEVGISMEHPFFFAAAIGVSGSSDTVKVSEAHQLVLQAAINVNAENAEELNVITLEQSYENTILVVFNMKYEWDKGEYLASLCDKLQASRVFPAVVIGVSAVYEGTLELKRLYTEAMIAKDQLRFSGDGSVLNYEALVNADTSDDARRLEQYGLELSQYLRQGNEELALKTLSDVFALLNAKSASYVFARGGMLDIMNALVKQAREMCGERFSDEIGRVLRMKDLNQAARDAGDLARAICQSVDQSRRDSNKRLGEAMLAYVRERYREAGMCLDMVAENFGLSNFYVSRFFSQYAGVPFREFIAKLRMDEAMRLLKDTDMPVRDVVLAVGYLDPSAFTKKFKQVMGVTPGEYRQQNQYTEVVS